MKNLVLSLFMLITPVLVFSQAVGDSIATGDTTGVAPIDSQRIASFFERFDVWRINCLGEGVALFNEAKSIGVDASKEFNGLPLPTSREGVAEIVEWVNAKWSVLLSLLTALIARLFSLAKKDPAKTIGTLQAMFNKVRTRYLVFGASLVVTLIGFVVFRDQLAWNMPTAMVFLFTMFTGSQLWTWVSEWISRLTKNKVPSLAAKKVGA